MSFFIPIKRNNRIYEFNITKLNSFEAYKKEIKKRYGVDNLSDFINGNDIAEYHTKIRLFSAMNIDYLFDMEHNDFFNLMLNSSLINVDYIVEFYFHLRDINLTLDDERNFAKFINEYLKGERLLGFLEIIEIDSNTNKLLLEKYLENDLNRFIEVIKESTKMDFVHDRYLIINHDNNTFRTSTTLNKTLSVYDYFKIFVFHYINNKQN